MSYINERDWDHIADEVSRKGEKLLQFVTECEELYQKHSALWQQQRDKGRADPQVTDGLAKQLMKKRRNRDGDEADGPANDNEVQMLNDLEGALDAMHAIYQAADFEALRKFL